MKTLGYIAGALSLGAATVGVAVFVPRPATADAPKPKVTATPRPETSSSPAAVASASRGPSRSPDEAPAAPEFPDLTQTDPDLDLPGSGNSYCGPVAVSNSLMWLALGDYPALAPDGPTPRARQLALVRELSSRRYMATSPQMGTGAFGLMEGLARWVNDAGYKIERFEYQGWRGHPLKYATYVKTPHLDWLAAALADGGVGWLHVGWYRPPTRWEIAYQRHGGHWLTVVAVDEKHRTLDLHDPAPYAGSEPAVEHVSTRVIEHGWLLAGKMRLRADKHLVLEGGMHVKRPDEVAIVDGAVTLVLQPPEAKR